MIVLVSWLLWLGMQSGNEIRPTRVVGEMLERALAPDDSLVAQLAAELRGLGEIDELLLEILVEVRVPNGELDGASAGLSEIQERVVLEALRTGDRRAVNAFVEDVREHPERVERVAVAIRLMVLSERTIDLDLLRALLQAVGSQAGARVEVALERVLLDRMARDAELFDALPAFCAGLSPEDAAVVVRALSKVKSPDAPRCLWKLLEHDDAVDACVLQALATTAELLPRDEALGLAHELVHHLDSDDPMRVVAAANAIGQLRAASSIPPLIELVASDDAPIARAALAALRTISGTGLAASQIAWRRWYAAEEIWKWERVPELVRVLDDGAQDELGRARLAAALGELSEHPLYRDTLAPLAAAGLECRDPGLRHLTCAALERLGSPAALPFLCAHLEDADEGVSAHAHRVMQTLARVDLPRERASWVTYLSERGLAPDDTPASSPRAGRAPP